VFPPDYGVSAATVAPGSLRFREEGSGEQAGGGVDVFAAGGLACGYRCTPGATTLVLARTSGPTIPSGATVLLLIDGLKSRGWEGASGVLEVRNTSPPRNRFTLL